jgi:hypothetical protein
MVAGMSWCGPDAAWDCFWSSPFCSGYFALVIIVHGTICLGLPWIVILPISASLVARIRGVSHWHLVTLEFNWIQLYSLLVLALMNLWFPHGCNPILDPMKSDLTYMMLKLAPLCEILLLSLSHEQLLSTSESNEYKWVFSILLSRVIL